MQAVKVLILEVENKLLCDGKSALDSLMAVEDFEDEVLVTFGTPHVEGYEFGLQLRVGEACNGGGNGFPEAVADGHD